jgi:hypothetical protein
MNQRIQVPFRIASQRLKLRSEKQYRQILPHDDVSDAFNPFYISAIIKELRESKPEILLDSRDQHKFPRKRQRHYYLARSPGTKSTV